jgi:hypothetical protein
MYNAAVQKVPFTQISVCVCVCVTDSTKSNEVKINAVQVVGTFHSSRVADSKAMDIWNFLS